MLALHFSWDLVRRVSWHRAENYMAGSQSFRRNVLILVGGAGYFAVGSPSRWFTSLFLFALGGIVFTVGAVLFTFSAHNFDRLCLATRSVACVHCCCCCSAICRRWRSDCPRRLTPSETIVAGIKNARP